MCLHFQSKLAFETDPSDVMLGLGRGQTSFVVTDVRGEKDYEKCHVQGAIDLLHRRINVVTATGLSHDKVFAFYCWGPGCNAATKAAARLSALGYRVKEMICGLEYWRREGEEIEGTIGQDAPMVG